ncbi:MAG: hypothetical protein ACR2KL_12860 [Nocardioidaceae bacterium]
MAEGSASTLRKRGIFLGDLSTMYERFIVSQDNAGAEELVQVGFILA